MQPRPRKQLVTKTITVPENLQRACDDFNAGRFYESHEHLEEIWQYERGRVRDAYKGLIQIAAAFVHLSRGKFVGAERLLRTGVAYLSPYRTDGALGFDIEEIASTAEELHARLLAVGPARVTDVDLRRRPFYRFDKDVLARQAVRDGAWGFDAKGKAREMEITIAA
jgi:hypothetical protein